MSADQEVHAKRKAPPKGARRRSRELALQAVYQWLVNETSIPDLLAQLRDTKEYAQADDAFLVQLLNGVIERADALRVEFAPFLDRPADKLSPVEHAVLLLGTYELVACPDVPYKVVINEAVELAKSFGGTDGHKYINGVLDRMAPALRPHDRPTRSNRA
jgi:transcription antitermination protein NusB